MASPTITTQASNGALGDALVDVATLSGGFNPTGSITFLAWGPDSNGVCGPTPAYTSNAVPVNGNGPYQSSPPFTPAQPGDYLWTVTYGGDGNNNLAFGNCNDANETSSVVTQS